MQKIDLHDRLTIAYSTLGEGNMDERLSERSVIMANRRKFLNHFNLNPRLVLEGKQIHGDRILALNEENTKMWYGVNIPGVDGFITDQNSVGILLKVADCVPVVVYDPIHHAVGIFHAGWKGTVKNIHLKGLTMLGEYYGTKPEDVLVWLGPSAHQCCFTSDKKPVQIEDDNWKQNIVAKKGEWQVDLIGYITDTYIKAGLKKKQIVIDKQCTVESPDLFSHLRSKRTGESEGRFLVLAKLR